MYFKSFKIVFLQPYSYKKKEKMFAEFDTTIKWWGGGEKEMQTQFLFPLQA